MEIGRNLNLSTDNAEDIFLQMSKLEGDTMLRVQLVIWDRIKNKSQVITDLERMLIALGLSSERINEYYNEGDMYTLNVPVSAFSLVDIETDIGYKGSGVQKTIKRLHLAIPGKNQRNDIPLGALRQVEVLEQLLSSQE